jgi:Tfp pilus assembly protein PilZ
MQELKRRKFERSRSLNLVDYVLVGEDGSHLSRGMGRTRNVSEGGLLLETHHPLKNGQVILITLGLKNDMVQLMGEVMHQQPPSSFSEETRHCAGVKFTAVNEEGMKTLRKYIQALETSEPA